eukprot:scaffold16264_cov56-Phaeocystis_antarctica.AAC.1
MEPGAPGSSGSSPWGPPAAWQPTSSTPPMPPPPHTYYPPAQPPKPYPRAPAPAVLGPPSAALGLPSAARGPPSPALAPSQSTSGPVAPPPVARASQSLSAGASPKAPVGGLEDAAGLLGLFAASKPAARPQLSPSDRERSNSASLGQHATSTHSDSNRQPQPLFRFRPDGSQQPAGAQSESTTPSAFRVPADSSKQTAFRPQLNSAKPPLSPRSLLQAASEPQDPATETMVVFDCRHPGCGKTFHSSDAVRKHARKQHVHWLRRIDEEASLTRLMHRTEQYSAKRIVLRSEHEASQRAVESDDSDDEPPEKKAPRAPAARPKLAPPPRPSLGGGRPSQDGASPRDDKKPSPSARSHKKQHKGAKAAESDEEVEPKEVEPAEDLSGYTQPSCRWNGRRSAYDAILPHGDGWSTQQIEWFVGLWWTHLANASVAVFHGSLEQFSAWAAATEGLECLVAWLKRMPELGEDLLLLQLLELLEYADLTPLALLPELTEVVRALKAYSDKDVAETAERVVLLLEELQTSESIAKEDRRRAKEKQRSERLHLRAVKAADHVSASAAKGGKRKGAAAAAPRSQQRQRREKDE